MQCRKNFPREREKEIRMHGAAKGRLRMQGHSHYGLSVVKVSHRVENSNI